MEASNKFIDVGQYCVEKMNSTQAKMFIRNNHYTKSCHNGPGPCYGLFEEKELIGVCAFATPCSENVRASVFGCEHVNKVVELHRLFIYDITPSNTESWFISRCLKMLKQDRPHTWAVLAFSDATEGHEGIIYQATNAWRLGSPGRARFWRDAEGRLRHPRQNGHNVTKEEASEMGWVPEIRESKKRYLWLTASDRREKKEIISHCKLI